jgi:hypothetical protein
MKERGLQQLQQSPAEPGDCNMKRTGQPRLLNKLAYTVEHITGNYWGCRSASMRSPLLDAPWTQKGWCPGSSWILTAVLYMLIMDCQQRITVGGASRACVSQRDSIGLHNVGGRMGEFCLLYLLCMLRFPVPLHSLHPLFHKHQNAHRIKQLCLYMHMLMLWLVCNLE